MQIWGADRDHGGERHSSGLYHVVLMSKRLDAEDGDVRGGRRKEVEEAVAVNLPANGGLPRLICLHLQGRKKEDDDVEANRGRVANRCP